MYNTSHKCADKEHDSLIIQKRSFNRNGKGQRDEARRGGIPGHAEGLLYAGIKLKKHSSGHFDIIHRPRRTYFAGVVHGRESSLVAPSLHGATKHPARTLTLKLNL